MLTHSVSYVKILGLCWVRGLSWVEGLGWIMDIRVWNSGIIQYVGLIYVKVIYQSFEYVINIFLMSSIEPFKTLFHQQIIYHN